MRISVEFEHEIDINGRNLLVDIEATYDVYEDTYGQDIDGNRGKIVIIYDLEDIIIRDQGGKDITKKLIDKYVEEFDKVVEMAEAEAAEFYND